MGLERRECGSEEMAEGYGWMEMSGQGKSFRSGGGMNWKSTQELLILEIRG